MPIPRAVIQGGTDDAATVEGALPRGMIKTGLMRILVVFILDEA